MPFPSCPTTTKWICIMPLKESTKKQKIASGKGCDQGKNKWKDKQHDKCSQFLLSLASMETTVPVMPLNSITKTPVSF